MGCLDGGVVSETQSSGLALLLCLVSLSLALKITSYKRNSSKTTNTRKSNTSDAWPAIPQSKKKPAGTGSVLSIADLQEARPCWTLRRIHLSANVM